MNSNLDNFNFLRPIILKKIEDVILQTYKIYIVDILSDLGFRNSLYSHYYEITERILKKLAEIKIDFNIEIDKKDFEKAIDHYLIKSKNEDYLDLFKEVNE